MEIVRQSETSVYFNETTRRYNPEGCHLHTRHSENWNVTYIYPHMTHIMSEILTDIISVAGTDRVLLPLGVYV
jgi:hypothetical protein